MKALEFFQKHLRCSSGTGVWKGKTMQGILTFSSLEEAVRAGFSVYDRTSSGYIVRAQRRDGFALAIVRVRGL
jgi:hypothetical protein